MRRSFFTKNNDTDYSVYSFNGNESIIQFKNAFQTSFIKFIFGPEVTLYEIFFENIVISSQEIDPKMYEMIKEILVDFMAGHKKCIVYYSIARLDGRNTQLSRLYSIWFNKLCQQDKSLRKSERVLLDRQHIVIDHISCIYDLQTYQNIDMDETFKNVLVELYPHCTIKS